MMATKKKKKNPADIPSQLDFLVDYNEHLQHTNARQDQIIETFLHTTQSLLEEKLMMSENYIESLQKTLNYFSGQRKFLYNFLKEKGFETSDIFEYINDKKIEHKNNSSKMKKLGFLEKMFYMDLMAPTMQEDSEEEQKKQNNDDLSDI